MKNMLAGFLIGMMLLSTMVAAPPVPYPIAVKVSTNLPMSQGLEVLIKDVQLNAEKSYVTNEYGEIIIDASEQFAGFRDTDTFVFTVVSCSSNSNCVKSSVMGQSIYVEFDLASSYCFACPVVQSCEDQGYTLPTNCPTVECPEVPEEKTVWDFTLELVITVVVAAAAGAGVGIKVTRYGTKLHEHRNIRGYHSPDITHKNQPHKKGEIAPKYATAKGSDGYYKYLGG